MKIFSKNRFFKYFQIGFLVLFLVLGWAFNLFTRLFQSFSSKSETALDSNFKKAQAQAAACWTSPGGGPPGGGGGGGGSTPFLAFWNGIKYLLENDILYGKPLSYFSDFKEGWNYYQGFKITPDLYKIQNVSKIENNILKFQIQEIEPEESFFNYLNLFRVIHPKNTEVVVDSDFKNFQVLGKKFLSTAILSDVKVSPRLFRPKEYVDLVFSPPAGGLKPSDKVYLITKTKVRDWVLGEVENTKPAYSKILAKITTSALLVLALMFWKKQLISLGLLPFMLIADGDPDGGGEEPGCGGGSGFCFTFYYKSNIGSWQYFGTVFPRAWQDVLELTQVPQQAFFNGKLEVRVLANKKHELNFIGLVKNPAKENFQVEPILLKRAWHNRANEEVGEFLRKQDDNFVHIIPGDTIDLEFEAPKTALNKNQKESYVIQASGFYTNLSQEGKKLAGNWQERISPEARARLAQLKPLSNYYN